MLNQWCMRCNKNPAVIKITKINKGQYLELSLCQDCAAEESPYQKKILDQQNLSALLTNLLKSKLNQEAGAPVEAGADEPNVACPSCGFTLDEAKETFVIGCPDCYTAFEGYMLRLLRKIHGHIQHTGKTPPGWTPGAEAAPAIAVAPPAPAAKAEVKPTAKPGAGEIDELPSGDPQDDLDELAALHRELKAATDADDFLRAAEIRDKIKALE